MENTQIEKQQLTDREKKLLGHILTTDFENAQQMFVDDLFKEKCEPYIKQANGNHDVIDGFLSEKLFEAAQIEAKRILPALGDSIVAYGRSLGGRAKIIKKEGK
jgi:hypothetical protein